MDKISKLHTEQRNPDTIGIANVSTMEVLNMINREDQKVALAVQQALPEIEHAVELIVEHMRRGGRMVYCGAGTSGRLGYMDAAECPPTYGVSADLISCIMAGGHEAVFTPQEKLEDSPSQAVDELREFGLKPEDVVVASSASGRTPFCIGALDYARSIGAGAVCIACNPNSEMGLHSEVAIEVDTGAEVIMGSTRMKAGTAQKMIMNMLSTAVMVRTGRTYDNLMVCMNCSNVKIENRALRLFNEATGMGELKETDDNLSQTKLEQEQTRTARYYMERAGGKLDVALLMYFSASRPEKAREALEQAGNFRDALTLLKGDAQAE